MLIAVTLIALTITAPIGMGVAERIGAYAGLTMCLHGVLGAVAIPWAVALLR